MQTPIRTILIASTILIPAAAGAQSGLDARVDKLESEMRAVQRTVFPGGAGKYVQPQITAPDPTVATPGTPATSAVADLETRVSAIERQQATLTGQIEQNQYRIRQLEDAFAAYKRTTDARLAAGAAGTDDAVPPAPGAGPKPAAPAVPPAGTVERPATGDAAEDSYLYGYRLWEAKRYPEAAAALKETVDKYPKSRRASYAQNLRGRAYFDDGKYNLAAKAFFDSFTNLPDGERAPDSLYFLGQSLMKLKKPADACTVYSKLDATYGAKIGPDLRAKVDRGRADAKCK